MSNLVEAAMLFFLESSSDAPFCTSDRHAMIMYMDGFRRTMNGGQHPCLNLFFPSWTLNTEGKFWCALLLVFWIAFAAEGLSKLRRRVVLAAKKAHCQSPPSATTTTTTTTVPNDNIDNWNPLWLRLSVTLIHGLQALAGYVLMLATMTFSLELLAAVIFGLATGYAIFFRFDEALSEQHVTSNPCCNFMEGEAREIADVDAAAAAGVVVVVSSSSSEHAPPPAQHRPTTTSSSASTEPTTDNNNNNNNNNSSVV